MSTQALTKPCRKCGTEKPLECFYKDARFSGSVDIHCSDCRKAKVREWRENNPERARAISLKSRNKHPEKARARAHEWYVNNRERALASMSDRRKSVPDVIRSEKLKANFGITLEQYNALAEEQKHACAICGTPQAEQKKKMAVDHNHATGRIRALLCHNCNVGLGNFKDSPEILTKAIKYIHEHSHSKTTTEVKHPSVCHTDNGGSV